MVGFFLQNEKNNRLDAESLASVKATFIGRNHDGSNATYFKLTPALQSISANSHLQMKFIAVQNPVVSHS